MVADFVHSLSGSSASCDVATSTAPPSGEPGRGQRLLCESLLALAFALLWLKPHQPVSTCQKSFDKIPFWGYRALRVHMLKEHSAEETAENVALLEQIDSIAGDDDELLSEEDEEDEEDETGLVVEPIGGATL